MGEQNKKAEATGSERFVDEISRELVVALVPHSVEVNPRGLNYPEKRTVVGIPRIPSARDFAAALERAGADATYSAASGWTFRHRAPTDSESSPPAPDSRSTPTPTKEGE